MSRRVGGNGDRRGKGGRLGRRVVTVCRNVTFLNRFFPFISSWPRFSLLMARDSDLSPLIAIDVFQLYLWHFKQYVCKHKGFLDLASCHLVWETSLIAIRCQSMGSRRKLCVLGPGMCFSFCLNMNIYSCIHLFPLEKETGNPFHVEENWVYQGQDPPWIQALCCGQKFPSGKHLALVPHTRGIEVNIPVHPD